MVAFPLHFAAFANVSHTCELPRNLRDAARMASWWSDLRGGERMRAGSDRRRKVAGRTRSADDPYGDRRFARRLALSREARAWALTATVILAALVRVGLLG
jgi:hypothetical protein